MRNNNVDVYSDNGDVTCILLKSGKHSAKENTLTKGRKHSFRFLLSYRSLGSLTNDEITDISKKTCQFTQNEIFKLLQKHYVSEVNKIISEVVESISEGHSEQQKEVVKKTIFEELTSMSDAEIDQFFAQEAA